MFRASFFTFTVCESWGMMHHVTGNEAMKMKLHEVGSVPHHRDSDLDF